MTRWYRAYEGTVTDAKLGEVALVAGCSRSVAIAAWHCILESCASTNEKGRFEMTPRRCAVILQEPIATIEAVFAEFNSLGLIEGTSVPAWSKRQYESDNSTERSRKHRATSRNSDATLQGRCATPPETETETETETKTEKDRIAAPRDASGELEAKLRKAAGWESHPSPKLFVTGAIEALLDAGAILETDVLPVVKAHARRVSSPTWNYFVPIIQDAVANRKRAGTGPPPKPNAVPEKSLEQLAQELVPGWKLGTKFASSTG